MLKDYLQCFKIIRNASRLLQAVSLESELLERILVSFLDEDDETLLLNKSIIYSNFEIKAVCVLQVF